jgi:hypothetical protein
MEDILTERQKYINKIQTELAKASMAKQFVNSSEGQYVINYIAELVTGATNKLINTRLSNEDYIETRAELNVLRKLKQVLETQANETVIAELSAKLSEATSEQ